jgi:molybdate/tungstate transport system substrate-binding protein
MSKKRYLSVIGASLVLLAPAFTQSPKASATSQQPPPATSQLIIYHAGSLTAAFNKIEAAFMAEHPDVAIVDKFGGSVNLARQVTVGGEPADLYASADYEDIDVLLKPKWANYTIRFAQGAMVLPRSTPSPIPAPHSIPTAPPHRFPMWFPTGTTSSRSPECGSEAAIPRPIREFTAPC